MEAAVTPRQDDPWADSTPDSDHEPVTPWTAAQVRALEQRQPSLSPWAVVKVQALVGGLLALAWWLFGTEPALQVRSTVWGAAAVVLPHALMAWGLRRRAAQAAEALLAFLWWELVKVALAIAILVAAVWAVPGLSWPALLVALIGCLKVHVWALWWFARSDRTTN
jgi:ATP synthase protein I